MSDAYLKARLYEFLIENDEVITTGTALRLAQEFGVDDFDITELDH